MMDLTLFGSCLIGESLKETFIGIRDGRIERISEDRIESRRHLDLTGKIILPGFIDPHVHFRDPGMTQKEDFTTGSLSALFAGVTTVFDMPNTIPPAISYDSLMAKKMAVKGRSYVDYALYMGLGSETSPWDMMRARDKVPGFKLFLGPTTGDLLNDDEDRIRKQLSVAKEKRKVVSVHAEDSRHIRFTTAEDCIGHDDNRPIRSEVSAIRKVKDCGGGLINICHCTNEAAALEAKEYGFTSEVTLHHLILNRESVGPESSEREVQMGSHYKVNPPLRGRAEQERLFQSFIQGNISMIGSDHAPHLGREKAIRFNDAPSGIPSIEVTMPILMNMVRRGAVPLKLVSKMASVTPSKVFNLNKGRIGEGFDADLAVFGMDDVRDVDISNLHGKSDYSPYQGMAAIFPECVILRGNVQIQDHALVGDMIGVDLFG